MSSINQKNEKGFTRLDQFLLTSGLDGLICMLPENVLFLTGTYPVHGVSLAVYLRGCERFLLQPACEQEWLEDNDTQVTLFDWGHLQEPEREASYLDFLKSLYGKHHLQGKKFGVEIDFNTCASAYRSAEMILPDSNFRGLIKSAFPGCTFSDCRQVIEQARAIKSDADLKHIRRASLIAHFGLLELSRQVKPGMSEVEAATLVESTIRTQGTGWQGARLVRAFAEVTSGPEGSRRQSMLIPAGQRKFEPGDLVIIELATVVDGYWSDLTRIYCTGEPTAHQREVYNAVRQAQFAASQQLIAGNTCSVVDGAARRVLTEAGLGQYFIHGSGHGVGWRYHEALPQLSPDNHSLLEAGMVTSLEPGVYIPGFGGIRIEDNLAVGETGSVWLSVPTEEW